MSVLALLGSSAVRLIVVEVLRSGVVEAIHRVHAVAVNDQAVVASAGDPSLVSYLRSSAKPLQALPLARARRDLEDGEIAIACASHLARSEQLELVRSLLAKAPASEDDLECGPEPTRLEHNCSGKHAGMLALCRARSWPSAGYRLADHPVQRAMLAEIAAAAEVDPDTLVTAVDGCGVVTFALSVASRASKADSVSRAPCASIRRSSAGRERQTPCSWSFFPDGSRKAARKVSCVRRQRTVWESR